MKRVIIMRGMPGSGKSTEAKRWASLIPGSIIVSADHYMYAGDQEFEEKRLAFCHEQCQKDYEDALKAQTPLVIVDNTNTKFSDLKPYVELSDQYGYEFTIFQIHVDPKVAFQRGTHSVPMETLEFFGRRLWTERLPEHWDVWSKGKPWRPSKDKKLADPVSQTAGYIEVILDRR